MPPSNQNTEDDEEQYGETAREDAAALQPGERVADREDDGKHLRVVAQTPHEASEAQIAAIGKTVAQVNEQYPATDTVYVCVYESDLDENFAARWANWLGGYLAFMVGNYGLQTYSFPRSRLAEAEPRPTEKWTAAAEGEADG